LAYRNFEFNLWDAYLTQVYIGDGSTYRPINSAAGLDSFTHLFSNFYDGSNCDSYIDNTLDRSTSETKTSTGALSIGARNTAPMYMSELLLYSSDQSSNRTGIEDNINDYYSIY